MEGLRYGPGMGHPFPGSISRDRTRPAATPFENLSSSESPAIHKATGKIPMHYTISKDRTTGASPLANCSEQTHDHHQGSQSAGNLGDAYSNSVDTNPQDSHAYFIQQNNLNFHALRTLQRQTDRFSDSAVDSLATKCGGRQNIPPRMLGMIRRNCKLEAQDRFTRRFRDYILRQDEAKKQEPQGRRRKSHHHHRRNDQPCLEAMPSPSTSNGIAG